MGVKKVPEGYHTATAYLIVHDAARAIEFYTKAFGARELLRLSAPGGKIGHAEIQIGDSPIMMADEHPEMGARSPRTLGGTAVFMMLYVENVDELFRQALAAGARELRPLKDEFYGDRTGTLEDPFGHMWTLATHKEDVAPEEIERRYAAALKKQGG
ncbi:MAG TPA: VOC family protein [Candidatus Polarisedimenticolia bacterium]|jgi:PhnB protein